MKQNVDYLSPIGLLKITGDNEFITSIEYIRIDNKQTCDNLICNKIINSNILRCIEELDLYFQGKLKIFKTKFLLIGTEFQIKVWNALLTIPYGTSCSYKDIMLQIGYSKGCQAVGQAIGANPLLIIVPCHRVIGINKRLTGFGAGLDVKKRLLDLENVKYSE